MHRFKWPSIAFIAFFIFSCGKPAPSLEGIDLAQWKEDKNGCTYKRAAMKDAVKKQKNKLLALNEIEIVTLLGKPDRNELFKRNQKFYYYFLDPSDKCTQHDTTALKLSIRFNAMGLAKEVMVE
jgi:hypothetical protein